MSSPRSWAHSPLADASRVLPELWCTCRVVPAPAPVIALVLGCAGDRRCSGKAGAGPEWKRVVPQPRLPGQWEEQDAKLPLNPSPGRCCGAPVLAVRATGMQESGGRRRRLDPSPCSWMRGPVMGLRAQGQAMNWWWHGGGRFVSALLPLLGETLTLKLCANGEVTKCFKARRQKGGRGKLGWGGKRVPQFSAQRSLFQPPPWEQPASGLRLPAMCPFLLWYWPALAGHLHRQKSRGRRRRKDGGARPAAALPAESDGKQRQDTEGKDGDVEERLSERGGMGSFSFSSVCPGEGL